MSRPVHFTPSTIRQARALVSKASSVDELRSAQAVLLSVDHGMSRPQIAALFGEAQATVGRLRSHARKPAAQKKSARRASWGGRRRALMTLEEERAFLDPFGSTGSDRGPAHRGSVTGCVGPEAWAKGPPIGRVPDAGPPWLEEDHARHAPSQERSIEARGLEKNSRRWWPRLFPARPPGENARG